MDLWNTFKTAASVVGMGSDSTFGQVLAAKKALTVLGDNSDTLVKLCLAAANGENYIVKDLLSEDSTILNLYDKSGFTPLIYAICFNREDIVELLVNFNADCNEPETMFGWTPIMWATYLNYTSIVAILLEAEADPQLKSTKSNKNAIDLVLPGSEMYEFYMDHNLIRSSSVEPEDTMISSHSMNNGQNNDDLELNIKLQVAGVTSINLNDNSEDQLYKSATFNGSLPFGDDILGSLAFVEPFDFTKVKLKQFIQFHDGNLTLLLDYVFSLYDKYQHRTVLPAAVIYQCLRYADSKLESKGLCETLLDLFLTRVRSTTNTKSGVPSLSNAQGDIVMLSYWLSVINFLYYYLYRDSACQFYKRYPKFLQEIVNTKQTLIAQLSFSINNRLDPLIDSCILNYTSLPDSKNVMFQKEWHFLKKKHFMPKSTYDEILDMLYPPPPKEQMKPSPIKVTQTLGALIYVLNLHQVNDLIKQQTLSAVLYWLGASLFDRILANKSYQSRTRAMQIRLNLSVIEDWLRSNDFKPNVVDETTVKGKDFPDKLTTVKLTNVVRYGGDINSPEDLAFYYNSLYKIGKHHLLPPVELLQWLQVMTTLKDEESFEHTLTNFLTLNAVQIYKVVKGYKYEIGESKFSKTLSQQLKNLIESKKYNVPKNLYFTTADKQEHLFLNPDIVFPVAIATLQQLLKRYGGEFSGHNDLYSRPFLPFLPLEVIDDIDEIYDQSLNSAKGQDDDNDDDDDDDDDNDDNGNNDNDHGQLTETGQNDFFRGDEIFKQVQMPSSMAHKTWGEIEENPW